MMKPSICIKYIASELNYLLHHSEYVEQNFTGVQCVVLLRHARLLCFAYRTQQYVSRLFIAIPDQDYNKNIRICEIHRTL